MQEGGADARARRQMNHRLRPKLFKDFLKEASVANIHDEGIVLSGKLDFLQVRTFKSWVIEIVEVIHNGYPFPSAQQMFAEVRSNKTCSPVTRIRSMFLNSASHPGHGAEVQVECRFQGR